MCVCIYLHKTEKEEINKLKKKKEEGGGGGELIAPIMN